MRGAPLKIIMAFDTRPSWFLLGTKNMKSIQDLTGKQLAVSSFGAALDQMTRELLPRFGMEPMRDVILRAIEPPPNRLAALLSGAVDAAVLTHPETIIARRQGFNQLLSSATTSSLSPQESLPPREISRRNLILSAGSSAARSKHFTGSKTTKRKSSRDWRKPQNLPRPTDLSSTGRGSSFFLGTARYREDSRRE